MQKLTPDECAKCETDEHLDVCKARRGGGYFVACNLCHVSGSTGKDKGEAIIFWNSWQTRRKARKQA